ncbi:MAG: hypothetical protein KDN22_32685 [Verrucomicrobiae bacterium]|nr:hypothetical protein [Verrucomicrobiae bacterium]
MNSCYEAKCIRALLEPKRLNWGKNTRWRMRAIAKAVAAFARRENVGNLDIGALALLIFSSGFVALENWISGSVAIVPNPAIESPAAPLPIAPSDSKPFSVLFQNTNREAIEQARDALWEFLVTPDSAVRGRHVYRPEVNLASITTESSKVLPFEAPLLTHLKSWSRKSTNGHEVVSAFLVRSNSQRREMTVEVGVDGSGKARINWPLFKQHAMGEFKEFMTHPFDESRGFFISVKRTHKATTASDPRWESFLISGTNPNRYATVRVKKNSEVSKHLGQMVMWDEVCVLRARLGWKKGLFPGDSVEVTIEEVIGGSWQGELK